MKKSIVETLQVSSYHHFYIILFPLLPHDVEDLEIFLTLSVLDASPFERYNLCMKILYGAASK